MTDTADAQSEDADVQHPESPQLDDGRPPEDQLQPMSKNQQKKLAKKERYPDVPAEL